MEVWTMDFNFSDTCLHKIRCLLNKIHVSLGHMEEGYMESPFVCSSISWPSGVLSRVNEWILFIAENLQVRLCVHNHSSPSAPVVEIAWASLEMFFRLLKVYTFLASTLVESHVKARHFNIKRSCDLCFRI